MRYIVALLFLFPVTSVADEVSQPFLADIEIGINLGGAKISEGSFDDATFHSLYIEKLITDHFSFYISHRKLDDFEVNNQSSVIVEYDEKIVLGLGVFEKYNKNLTAYARVNVVSWELDSAFSGNTLASESGESFGFSLGVKYMFLNKLGANIEYFSVQNVSDADINSLSVGLFFQF